MGKKKITIKEKKWMDNTLDKLKDPKHFRLKDTVDPNSNFINLNGGYFNKGKYKGIEVNRSPVEYLNWLLNKSMIVLNRGEIKLINKLIENKKPLSY